MKTFFDGKMMIVVSALFMMVASDAVVAEGNDLSKVESSSSSRKRNLRRSLSFREQQLGDLRRHLDGDDSQEVESEEPTDWIDGEEDSQEIVIEEDPIDATDSPEEVPEDEFDNGDGADPSAPLEETNEPENIETTEEPTEVEQEIDTESPVAAPTEPDTEPPVAAPTDKPTSKEYTITDDNYDPIQAADEKHAEEAEVYELETELKQEEKVARRAGGLGIFLGIVAMIFTAHQMSENPDGIYASVCRLAITISSVILKILCMPCRKLIGVGGNGNPHYAGHMPISTNDYSYRNDPYRSNANAGFEMS